jgi:ribulose-bisphosphate carboxylase large chain
MTDTRFTVVYQISAGDESGAMERAMDICVEQTVEIPLDVVPEHLKDTMVGQIVELVRIDDSYYRAAISYPLSGVGTDTVQFLNMLFGNISLKPGVKITGMDWSAVAHLFSGPRFGIAGIRSLIGIPHRAMSCTSIKPIGLNAKELADVCYQFAVGGLDIFKDDHGLANQDSARFDERVTLCVDAILRAADKTGKKSLYFPNITADGEETVERYLKAAELGADGVLVMPQLTGITILQKLSKLEPALPIMAHPAFAGPMVIHPDHGFTPAFYFGELWRALGADLLVYPNAN